MGGRAEEGLYLSVQQSTIPTKVFHLGLTAEATEKQPSGNEERAKEGALVGIIWQVLDGTGFLMSQEDPQTLSGGCRGALYSVSGRRRWRGRRCISEQDGFHSDSESL